MKVFHDGIIITEPEQIVLKNKQIEKTLNIKLNINNEGDLSQRDGG